ncbi:hypothetical protein BU15DRAFT_50384 [Melanogaster broomeanus]|nr:hypothetical protein BU15DRAFT_50384 [Melanogaster broomeanus]
MVLPDRQSHIVATLPEKRGYGRYRNMTPHGRPTSALNPLQRINTVRRTQLQRTIARASQTAVLTLVSAPKSTSLHQPEINVLLFNAFVWLTGHWRIVKKAKFDVYICFVQSPTIDSYCCRDAL